MNVPNAISFARICAVPVVVWLILNENMTAAFWVVLVAAVSDAVDGIIAKRFELTTVLGGYLDPLADKALLVSSYIALGHQGFLPVWLVILVVFRDALILVGAYLFHALTQALDMSPLMISKVNTVAQLVLAITVIGSEGLRLNAAVFVEILILIVAASTFASGVAYVSVWTRKAYMFENGRASGEEAD